MENQPLLEDLEKGTNLTISINNEPDQTVTEPGSSVDRGNNVLTKPDQSWSEIPGLWPSSINEEYCCIYRVPNELREVNPNAYTPQMLLIGPLHHSKKAEAVQLSKTDSRYIDYINMERHKKKYLKEIEFGDQTIEEFRKIIKKDEEIIRANYAESTEWIKSQDFIEMILQDSVFILTFITKLRNENINKTGDIIFDQPNYKNIILNDLILLENQLPYTLLEKLFEPFQEKCKTKETFRDMILGVFGFIGMVKKDVKFKHLTDLIRYVRVQTLGLDLSKEEESIAKFGMRKSIKNLRNASELESSGVEFVGIDEDRGLSLKIRFEDGILRLPCLVVEDRTESLMRNMMAFEQCHYPYSAYVCNYIIFLDYLIDKEQDVDLLVKKGVIINYLGYQRSVAEMVNNLCVSILDSGSNYYDIAKRLNKHYDDRVSRSIATLKQVYFKDLWTGTATIAAVVLLVLTLIQTVASILQVTDKDSNKSSFSTPTKRI